MITNKEPKYKDKLYCSECKHAYEVCSNECNICSHPFSSVFKVDERYSDLIQFNALRSMRSYNVNVGNV